MRRGIINDSSHRLESISGCFWPEQQNNIKGVSGVPQFQPNSNNDK